MSAGERPVGAGVQDGVFPPVQGNRLGATLISALLALTITAVCAGLLLQTCLMGSALRNRLTTRTQAFAACQSQLEQLRARGYHALPSLGRSSFDTGSARLTGATVVAVGPIADTRQVAVTVSWQPGEALPAGQVSLSTIMAARGLSP